MSDVAKGADGCVSCSSVEICNTDVTPATNASKCAPGYKLHNAGVHCVLCENDEYCHDSRGYACPLHSSTMQKRGTVELSACVCKPGYHYIRVADAGICHECSRPFFCTGSSQSRGKPSSPNHGKETCHEPCHAKFVALAARHQFPLTHRAPTVPRYQILRGLNRIFLYSCSKPEHPLVGDHSCTTGN